MQGKTPPQFIGIAVMAIGKETNPDAAAQDNKDRGKPAGRKGLGEKRGAPIKLGPAAVQSKEHDRQPGRLFVIKTLEQREQDAGSEQDQGKEIGHIQPFPQTGCQNQQPHAGHAAEKMGQFHHRQGVDRVRQKGRMTARRAAAAHRGRRRQKENPPRQQQSVPGPGPAAAETPPPSSGFLMVQQASR